MVADNSNDKKLIADAILVHLNGALGGVEGAQNFATDSDLIASGLLDSLSIVGLIQFIETQFDLQIDDDDIEPELFLSANHLASYVLAHQKNS